MNEILIRLIRLNSLSLKFVLFVSLDVQKNFNIEKHGKNECLRQYIILSHRNHRKHRKKISEI